MGVADRDDWFAASLALGVATEAGELTGEADADRPDGVVVGDAAGVGLECGEGLGDGVRSIGRDGVVLSDELEF